MQSLLGTAVSSGAPLGVPWAHRGDPGPPGRQNQARERGATLGSEIAPGGERLGRKVCTRCSAGEVWVRF